jgi:hypothetical protein
MSEEEREYDQWDADWEKAIDALVGAIAVVDRLMVEGARDGHHDGDEFAPLASELAAIRFKLLDLRRL